MSLNLNGESTKDLDDSLEVFLNLEKQIEEEEAGETTNQNSS